MRTTAATTVVAEYDLLDENATADAIESFFRKPLAKWGAGNLEPGQRESITRAFIRSTETRKIEIDRRDRVIWVTYGLAIELDYSDELLEYFGTDLRNIVGRACQVTFPLDERAVELVMEDLTMSVQ